MGYQVQIIEADLSVNDGQASIEIDKIVSLHLQTEEKPSSTLLKLYKLLVKKYPCLSSYRDDDPKIDDCVWADGPLLNNFGQHAAVLEIASDEEQVMAFILQCASELNLTVVDFESGFIFRPNSPRALSYIAAQAEAERNSAGFNLKSVTEYVVSQLSPIFLAQGFKWKKANSSFVRKIAGGDQRVWIYIWERHKEFRISCQVVININRVTELKRIILENPKVKTSFMSDFSFFADGQDEYRVSNFEALVGVTQELYKIASEKIIAHVQEITSMQVLNGRVSAITKGDRPKIHSARKDALILGYIAAPSDFEQLVEFYKAQARTWDKCHLDEIDQMVNYLKQHDVN